MLSSHRPAFGLSIHGINNNNNNNYIIIKTIITIIIIKRIIIIWPPYVPQNRKDLWIYLCILLVNKVVLVSSIWQYKNVFTDIKGNKYLRSFGFIAVF